MEKIAVIGYGNMGSAFCKGLVKAGFKLAVAEKKEDRQLLLKEELGLEARPSQEIVAQADLVFLAVKPQELTDLAEELVTFVRGKAILSIIAGYGTDYFIKTFSTSQVCRMMPNLAAAQAQAAIGVCFTNKAEPAFKNLCLRIAEAVGKPFLIHEKLMAAFTGLSGSGIAYIFSFIHALALGGVATGFSYDEALAIAQKTVEGALSLLADKKHKPLELMTRVISPAGTTIAGLKQLEAQGFNYAIIKALEEATRRAGELEGYKEN